MRTDIQPHPTATQYLDAELPSDQINLVDHSDLHLVTRRRPNVFRKLHNAVVVEVKPRHCVVDFGCADFSSMEMARFLLHHIQNHIQSPGGLQVMSKNTPEWLYR